MSVTPIAPRPVPMEAFRWDGTESSAQAIALWLVERDGRGAWDQVRYIRESGHSPKLYLQRDSWAEAGNSLEASSGEWVVRFGTLVLVLDQETFDHYFTTTDTLVIHE